MDNILLQAGILLFTGIVGAKIIRVFRLPAVTGYLIGGLLIGPYCLGLVTLEATETLTVFSDIALGFIAFSIGSEFKISYFKRVGMTPIVIAVMEGVMAVIFVTCALLLCGQEFSFSLMLGAIASATAPAATIMVIKQYKAKGSVTETLLSVVAIDDAVALIAFGFSLAVTRAIHAPGTSVLMSVLSPFIEVLTSVILGAVFGIVFTYVLKFMKDRAMRLSLIIAFVLTAVPVADACNASSLMVCMVLGAVFTNLSSLDEKIMTLCDEITPPLFMLFFVLSGAELNIRVIPMIGVTGIIYVLLRVLGKVTGAALGAKIMRAEPEVSRYLGPCLVPQAGVAIGLSLIAQANVPGAGETIRAIILCATLIYELVGPAITKMSLIKAGEISEEAA